MARWHASPVPPRSRRPASAKTDELRPVQPAAGLAGRAFSFIKAFAAVEQVTMSGVLPDPARGGGA
jgi:hypothetical protein